MLEQTLLIIKPDAVKSNIIGEIISRVEAKGYKILTIDMLQLRREEAEAFYEVHCGKPFYEKLVEFMCSGPCIPVVVKGEKAIEGIRNLVGNTDPLMAKEGTIRKDFAKNIRENCVHASDGAKTARQEISFFFERRRSMSFI